MNTKKVAITVPIDLVTIIDAISRQEGISRSRYISSVLREKIADEKVKYIRQTYDRLYSDELIKKEQIETASWFDGTGNKVGQEW